MKQLVLAAGLAAFALSGPAHATLSGTTIDVTAGGGFFAAGDCSGLTVGMGVECRIQDTEFSVNNVIDVDVQGSRIVFELLDIDNEGADFLWITPPFVFDVVISGLTWVEDPLATIASISTTTELFGVAGGLGFPNTIGATLSGPNQVTLNFGDLDRVSCDTQLCARVTVDIRPEHGAAVIPLPAGLPLLLGGLAVLGTLGARRRA